MKAKKYLGQHFLHNQSISQKISSAICDLPIDQLLEVGPGKGALTELIQLCPGKTLTVVETDRDLLPILQKNFPGLPIIHANFLKVNLGELAIKKPFAIVGNFPYNISSQIVFKAIENHECVPFVLGMFQKEMAERIAGSPGSKAYGVISVLTQAIYNCDILFTVDKQAFKPQPKVQSAVIQLTHKKEISPVVLTKAFKTIVKLAFGQRRKMLRNSLKSLFEKDILEQDFYSKRPEQLSIEEFIEITNQLKSQKNVT